MLVNKTAVTTFLYSVLAMQLYIGRQYCFLNVLYATNTYSPSLSLPYFLSLQHDLLFLTSATWFTIPDVCNMILLLSNIPRTCHHHWTSDTYSYDSRRSSGYGFIFLYFFKFLENFVDPTFHLTTYSLFFVLQTLVSFSRILLYFLTHVFLQQSITFS